MSLFTFEAIGTSWRIEADIDLKHEAEVLAHIRARIEEFDRNYSRFRGDSLVTKISKKAGTYELPVDAQPLFDFYKDLYDRTNGLVTPLIGNLISDAGYDANYSLKTKERLSSPPEWNDVLEYSFPELTVKQPVLLDFGAAGKGYLIDIIGDILRTEGVKSFVINAGGDILVSSSAPIQIGLENPDNVKEVVGSIELKSGSICGSAGNRRRWGSFTHIINPKTMASPKGVIAVWVVADEARIADGLTTCLFFVEPQSLQSAYNFEYAIIRADRSFETSPKFPGKFFRD